MSAWAGIRPLAAPGATGAPSSASREHSIVESAPGLVRVTGGKLTTYRSMAARGGGHGRARARPHAVAESHGDARRWPAATCATRTRRSRTPCRRSATRRSRDGSCSAYGTAWHGVWSLTEADPALASFVEPGLPYLYAELLHAITHEQAATLGDLLIRRTPIAFETRDHGTVGGATDRARRGTMDAVERSGGGRRDRGRTTRRASGCSASSPTPATGRPAADRGSS